MLIAIHHFQLTLLFRTPIPTGNFKGYPIQLGPVGRPDATQLNQEIQSFIPFVYKLLLTGGLTPAEYIAVGDGGFKAVLEAYAFQSSGKGGNKKVIVKISD